MRDAGFDVVGEYGLSLADESLAAGEFDAAEVAAKHGVFAEIADCYFLAYVCRLACEARLEATGADGLHEGRRSGRSRRSQR